MEEATIVGLVIAALVVILGLAAALAKPLMSLTRTMTENTAATRELTGKFEDFVKYNDKDHAALWLRVDENTETVNDHETRLSILEHK